MSKRRTVEAEDRLNWQEEHPFMQPAHLRTCQDALRDEIRNYLWPRVHSLEARLDTIEEQMGIVNEEETD